MHLFTKSSLLSANLGDFSNPNKANGFSLATNQDCLTGKFHTRFQDKHSNVSWVAFLTRNYFSLFRPSQVARMNASSTGNYCWLSTLWNRCYLASIKVAPKPDMAETRGFEPPRPFKGSTSLAVRRTRPGYATSPSVGQVYSVIYALFYGTFS